MTSAQLSDPLSVEQELGSGFYGSRRLAITAGRGALLESEDGREYIDCMSMIGVSSLGHAHPAVVTAISEQAGKLLSCFGSFANDTRSKLYRALQRILPQSDRFFLCNSGTESIEAALKVACASTGRRTIHYLQNGFHGRTLGALSLNARPKHRQHVDTLLPETRCLARPDAAELAEALTDDSAALFVECIQGEGGLRPLDAAFLREAQDLCRRNGTLLVVDEVQSGFGRTGRWFAFEHAGLDPDLVCLAKAMGSGVPVGCVAVSARVGQLSMGTHGSTFGGNPLAAAAALATIEVIEANNLCERAASLGELALERLAVIPSNRVREVRGRGLMIGIDLRSRAQPVVQRLQQRGVLVATAGPTVIRLLPPLIISEELWGRALSAVIEEIGQ